MSSYQINDKYNFGIVKKIKTGETLSLTNDFLTEGGQIHISISPGGPTTTNESTMGGGITHITGRKPQTISINLPTRSHSARTLTKWMNELVTVDFNDSVLRLVVGYREPTTNELVTHTFDGGFKEIPEEQIGGGIHKQNWEFLGYKSV